jgi:hypothetical protein
MGLTDEQRKIRNNESSKKYRSLHLEQIRVRDREIARRKRQTPEYKQHYKEYRSRPENKKRDAEAHRKRRENPEIRNQINQQQREYYHLHKEKAKQYYQENKENQVARALKWNREHMEQIKEREKNRYHQNPESKKRTLERNSRWSKQHRESVTKRTKKWRLNHSEQFKEMQAKEASKRRGLGFIPLNEPFDGAVRHHIDKEHVVYIPEELHVSVSHCIWTGKGMEEINAKVFEWLKQQQFKMFDWAFYYHRVFLPYFRKDVVDALRSEGILVE